MSKRTIESLKKEVEELTNGEYIILSTEYHNNKEKLLFKHNIPECGKEFLMSPHCFLHQNQRCPEERYKRRVNPQQYSFEDVTKKVKEISNDAYMIEEFQGVPKKAKFTHKECGNIFYMTVNHFFCGNRCPKCSKRKASRERILHSEILNKKIARDISYYQSILDQRSNGKFKIISKEFTNTKDKNITIFCNECKNTFTTDIGGFIQRLYCSNCYKKKQIEEIKNIPHENFKILSDIDSILKNGNMRNSFIKLECKKCNSQFQIGLKKFKCLNGDCRCPVCGVSHQEKKIYDFLSNLNLEFETEKVFKDCSFEKYLKFDFFIKDLNLLIEYDGEFHYLPIFGEDRLKKQQKRDEIKNEYSKEKKINLLRIPYWEKEHISKIIMEIKNMTIEYNENYNLDIRRNIAQLKLL